MSKQRRKHPEIVARQKHFHGVKKGLSVLHNFQQYICLSRVWQDLPRYHGTDFAIQLYISNDKIQNKNWRIFANVIPVFVMVGVVLFMRYGK